MNPTQKQNSIGGEKKTKYFYDTEFIEDGNTIDLISIGIVCEDGREFYAESWAIDWSKADQWVLDNVKPHLKGESVLDKGEMRKAILEFVGDDKPEFWAYYADYDHVALCQIFGRMIDLPEHFPMYTKDLKQVIDEQPNLTKLPPQENEHDALADAHWNRKVYEALTLKQNPIEGEKKRVLNLYAGIGGNRKLWGDRYEVTAVENVPEIAEVYKRFFPNDEVIVGDAHEYLLKHFQEYDFIWSSPPCQSHSKTNFFLKGQGIFRYPDMTLYQEILFLQYFFKGKYVVENVQGYYKPLVEPQKMGRHYFWANFEVPEVKVDYVQIGTMNRQASKDAQRKAIIREAQIPELTDLHGLNLTGIKLKNKRQILRNCVYPELGLKILEAGLKTN